ncbi:MAG: TolC family protein [Syntrophobacterales bacterium]|nr:TolC family protein [Syntrophobacterales bacterium]
MRSCCFWGRTIIYIVFVALTSGIADAADAGFMTLSESVEIAIKQSLRVNSAKEGVFGAEAVQREAFTGFLPKFSTSYSYTRLNEEPSFLFPDLSFTLPGAPPAQRLATGTKNNYNWNVEVRQPLYAGGGIAAGYEASQVGAEIARLNEQQTILDVVYEVRIAYFNILKAQRAVEVAVQALKRLTAHRDAASAFYETGIIPRNDLLRAEVELAAGRQSLLRAENGVELAKARFNTLLRRKINSPATIEDSLTKAVAVEPLDACIAAALARRPEIQAYQLRWNQAKILVKQAKSEYYPNLSLSGNYARYGDTPGVAGSDYRDQENWYVMAVANWTFWEWGKTKDRVDAGKSRENQAADLLAGLREQIALEVKSSYLLFGEAQKQLPVAKKAIEQAEENFRINTERYSEQVGTATDVIDAQTILTAALSDYQNYLGDLNMAKARLDRAMGAAVRTGR